MNLSHVVGPIIPLLAIFLALHANAQPPATPKLSPEQETQAAELVKLLKQNQQLTAERKLGEATTVAEQAVKLSETIFGRDHSITANCLWRLADNLHSDRKHAQALPHAERALKIRLAALGKDHELTAAAHNLLGVLYKALANYPAAKPHFEEWLRLERLKRGDKHLSTATALTELGRLLHAQGDYARARTHLEESLQIRESVQGPDHADVAMACNHVALTLQSQANYQAARPYLERALQVNRKTLGEQHVNTANAVHNLGYLFLQMYDFKSARPHLEQALELTVAASGENNYLTAECCNSLAILMYRLNEHAEARKFSDRAMAIKTQIYGPNHPDLALGHHSVAYLLKSEGDIEHALPHYEESLRIELLVYGESHPRTTTTFSHLVMLEAARARWDEAFAWQERARRAVGAHIGRVLPGLSEAEQLTFLRVNHRPELDTALSLALVAPASPERAAASAGWLANSKGVAQQALAARALQSRDLKNPKFAESIAELTKVRQRLAAIALSAPQPGKETQRRDTIKQLTEQEAQAERSLAAAGVSTVAAPEYVEMQRIRAAVPADAVLVDIVQTNIFRFEALRTEFPWNPPRYVAWVTPPEGKGDIRTVDLGPAAPVDALVQRVREQLESAGGSDGTLAKDGEEAATVALGKDLAALAERIWKPLAIETEGLKQLILCPDAALWLAPWAALPVGKDSVAPVLIEQCSVRYVTSARDLLRKPEAPQAIKPPAILANPAFDETNSGKADSIRAIFKQLPPTDADAVRGFAGRSVLPKVGGLPGTAAEAAAIQPSLEQFAGRPAVLYAERHALESVAKRLVSPPVAVFATHGFFLPDEKDAAVVANPLLRCGLLLAGCNDHSSIVGDDDGVLSGMEITGIDLRGSKLVVLSACQTGIGRVNSGEGVAGLRQAFQLAGANAVVSTLWQIPDRDSALIMNDFFKNLAAGRSQADAVRAAQLKRIEARRERNGAAHPFYWAAWTITGG